MNFAPLLEKPLHPAIAMAVREFQAIAPGDALPRKLDFRPSSLRLYLGFVFLVDVLPNDYRWSLVGEQMQVLFGIPNTNPYLSYLIPAAHRGGIKETYDTVVETRSFLYVRGRYSWPDRSVEIERLLVPLADGEGRLNAIFGMTVPNTSIDLLHVYAGVGAAKLEIDEQLAGA